MKIDLVVDVRRDPSPPQSSSRLPAIERCLARGEAIPAAAESFADTLLTDFGQNPDDAPCAAIALVGEGDDPGSHYWMRADPISLQATMHRLMGGLLADGDLDWSEARARADVLGPHLHEDGCELVLKHPQRWYVRCPSPQQVRTRPPPEQMALLEEASMPSGPDGPRWQRLMTEAQMLFFSAELDQSRDAARRAPANGIWVWGGGQAPRIVRGRYTTAYSDDVLALGLGRLSGATVLPLPDDARDIVSSPSQDDSRHVLVAISKSSASDLQWVESNWVAPIVSLVATGRAAELRLRLFRQGDALGSRITRPLLRRWWRRARALSAHA